MCQDVSFGPNYIIVFITLMPTHSILELFPIPFLFFISNNLVPLENIATSLLTPILDNLQMN